MINSEKTIKVVELFAGVGGFRLGLERASAIFDTIFANQWEPNRKKQWAFECYVHHFGESPNHSNENISIAKKKIMKHDLLVGGFPCQDYSVAHGNRGKGIQGKKGVLWWDILDVVNESKPSFILLENVDRLIKSPSKQRGRDFGIMLKTLSAAGYNCEWRVINAADYGFAQKRKRVFIFAYRKKYTHKIYGDQIDDLGILDSSGFFADTFPVIKSATIPKHNNVNLSNLNYVDLVDFSDNFSFKFLSSGLMIDDKITTVELVPMFKEPTPLGKIIETGALGEQYFVNGATDKLLWMKSRKKVLRVKPNGEEYYYSEGSMSFPDSLEKPARTMLTSEKSINRSTHIIVDPLSNRLRYLTPIEAERINGFDDNWTNTGMPDNQRYFCMGNALVVPLITIMGKKIEKIWSEL